MGQVSHDLRGLLWFPIVFLKVLVGGSGWGFWLGVNQPKPLLTHRPTTRI